MLSDIGLGSYFKLRAFQEKKIWVGAWGYSWGTRTRDYVVLGNYEKYFSMPIVALNPQN